MVFNKFKSKHSDGALYRHIVTEPYVQTIRDM